MSAFCRSRSRSQVRSGAGRVKRPSACSTMVTGYCAAMAAMVCASSLGASVFFTPEGNA